MNQLRHESSEESLANLMALLWRQRIWIIGATVVCAAVAALYAWVLATPVYRAEVILAAADQPNVGGLAEIAGQLSGLASLAGIGGVDSKSDKDVAIATLTAPGFLAEFVEQNKLLPVLFASKWDSSRQRWMDSVAESPPVVGDAIRLLQRRVISVTEDRRSGLVRLAVRWQNSDIAARWANELVQRVNSRNRQQAIAESRKNQAFLRTALQDASVVELRESVSRLLEAQINSEMLATARPDYSFRVIDPARVPDPHDFVSPRRMLLVAFGVVVGFGLGVLMVLFRNLRASGR
jgi:uncharacterized protein involved in exopolysaccharide biosynthesis